VFVTHDQEEALALSDIVAVMDRGRIVQIGSPRELYGQPTSTYSADFLGSANLVPVESELTAVEASVRRFKVPGGTVAIPAPPHTGSNAPRKLFIALRREEIGIVALSGKGGAASGHGEEADNQLAGRIEGIEFRGSITGYRIRTQAGLLHVDVWSALHGRPHERGEDVIVQVPPTAKLVEGAP
jgi:iron(III) transport system ATP-binding protein